MPARPPKRLLLHGAWLLPLLALAAFFAWPESNDSAPRERRARSQRIGQEDGSPSTEPQRTDPVRARTYTTAAREGRGDTRVRVAVLVVGQDGEPVPDALVEVRALARLYDAPETDAVQARNGEVAGDDWGSGEDRGNGDDWGDHDRDDADHDDSDEEERRETVESARTDRDGIALVEVWSDVDVAFHASDDTGRAGASDLDSFDAPPRGRGEASGDVAERIRIMIAAPATLHGRVTDARGDPVPGAMVVVGSLTDVELDDGVDVSGTSAATDAGGEYRFELNAAGAFYLEVEADGFQYASEEAVQALPGRETRRDFTLVPAEVIEGVVLDAGGNPAPDAHVIAVLQGERWSGESWDDGEEGASTDDEGRFRFDRLKSGRYVIAVEPESGRPAEMFDVESGRTDLILHLTEGGHVSGTVAVPPRPADSYRVDADVRLLPANEVIPLASGVPPGRELDAVLGLVPESGQQIAMVVFDEDGKGRFEARGLPPGSYDLIVTRGTAAATRRVRIREGATVTLAIDVPDGTVPVLRGRLRVLGGFPFRYPHVIAAASDDSILREREAIVKPDGTFEFPWLPPGRYTVEAQASVRTPEGDQWSSSHLLSVEMPAATQAPLELVLSPRSPERRSKSEIDDEEWTPDIEVDTVDGSLVVLAAPNTGGTRLLGGDRLVSIDDTPLGPLAPYDAEELLTGAQGSLCRIRAHRPATGETIEVVLPRDHDAGW